MILAGSTPRGIRTTPKLNRAHSTPTHKAPNAPRTLPNRIRTKINYLLRHNLFGSYSFFNHIYIYTHCIYTIDWGGHPEIHPNPPQSTPPHSTEQTMCNCWSIVSSSVCYTFCCLCSRALPSQCQWIKSSKARMTELLSPNVWQKTQQAIHGKHFLHGSLSKATASFFGTVRSLKLGFLCEQLPKPILWKWPPLGKMYTIVSDS